MSISIDPSGNPVVGAYFQLTVDFNPGPGTFNMTSTGSTDIAIIKFSPGGTFLLARQLGGGSADGSMILSVATDPGGNIIASGYFEGSTDLDPGPGTDNHSSIGNWDIFIVKLNSAGTYMWGHTFGGTSLDYGASVATDPFGSIYLYNHFYSTVDFDPGPSTVNLTAASNVILPYRTGSERNLVWQNAVRDATFSQSASA